MLFRSPCKIVDVSAHLAKPTVFQEVVNTDNIIVETPVINPIISKPSSDLNTFKNPIDDDSGNDSSEHIVDNYPLKYSINIPMDNNTGNSTVIFGSSKAGKSTLLMNLYKQYYREYISVLFTESPQLKLFKDNRLIIAPELFGDIIRDMHKINKGTKNKYKFCALLDDIVDQKENILVRKLILILRNSNISSVVSLQSPKLLSKSNRGSVNNYIFFKFNTDEMIEEIIKLFLSSFLQGKMDQKIKQYKNMTENHQFIYYRPLDDKISVHKLLC